MSDLKETWRDTGKGLAKAFKGVGKALIKTAKAGIEKADAWANSEEEKTPDDDK